MSKTLLSARSHYQWKLLQNRLADLARAKATVRLPFEQAAPRIARQLHASMPEISGPSVVVAIPGSWIMEQMLVFAIALRLRGVDVHLFICDRALESCENTHVGREFRRDCAYCFDPLERIASLFPFPLHRLSNLLDQTTREEAAQFVTDNQNRLFEPEVKWGGYSLRDLFGPTLSWHYMYDNPDILPELDMPHVRRLAQSAICALEACKELIRRVEPRHALVWNGNMVTCVGLRLEMARQGRHAVAFEYMYKKGTLLVGENESASEFSFSEAWPHRAKTPLTAEESRCLDAYFQSRVGGFSEDRYGAYNPSQEHDSDDKLRQELQLPNQARVVLLLTNLPESAYYGRHLVFRCQREWLLHCIEGFTRRYPNEYLVIRVHPAEKYSASSDRSTPYRTEPFIKGVYPELPRNIRLVESESNLSTYRIAELATSCLAYGSLTATVEMSLLHKPVVLSADGPVRGRGFTYDANSLEELDTYLDNIFDLKLDSGQIELARRFAYLYLIGCQVAFPYNVSYFEDPECEALWHVKQLRPGYSEALDRFCDAFLRRRSFYDCTGVAGYDANGSAGS